MNITSRTVAQTAYASTPPEEPLIKLQAPCDFANAALCIGGADKSYIQKINEYVDFTLFFTDESQIARRFGSDISHDTKELFQEMRTHCHYFHSEVEHEIYRATSNLSNYTVTAAEVLKELITRIDGFTLKQQLYQALPKDMKELIDDILIPDANQYLRHSEEVSEKLNTFYQNCLNDLNRINTRIDENKRQISSSLVSSLTTQVDELELEAKNLYSLYQGFIKRDQKGLKSALRGAVVGAVFQNPTTILSSLVAGYAFSVYFGNQTNKTRISFYLKMKEIETVASKASDEQIKSADLQRFRSYLIYLKHLLEPAQVSVRNLWVLWTNIVHDLGNLSETLDHASHLEKMIQVKKQLLLAKASWESVGEKINNIRREVLWQ